MRSLVQHQIICWWLSHIQRDPDSSGRSRPTIGLGCTPTMGKAVAHELPSPEVSIPPDNEEEVSSRGWVLYPWPHAGEGRHCQVSGSFPAQTLLLVASHPSDSEEGQQHPCLPPAKPPYGSNNHQEACLWILVRPIMEYSSVVWDPHPAVEVNRLEMVQRRYDRYVCNDYGRTSSVTSMLKTSGGNNWKNSVLNPASPCCSGLWTTW